MTSTAFDDQYTTAPEPVRQPYDTVAILRRNVADLELALRTQTELKEKAEAELAQARQQKPVAWRHENGNLFLSWQKDLITTGAVFSPLYAAPVPAPAAPTDEQIHVVYRNALGQSIRERDMPEIRKFARALLQSAPQAPAAPEQKPIWSGWSVWFKGGDGLFPAHFLHDSYGIPLRFPTRFDAAEKIKRHTKDSRELYEPREYSLYDAPQAPAVPSVVFMAHNKTSSILFAARKDADQYAASFGPAAGVSVTECAVIGSQSAPQAPAVPELDPMTRLIVSDPKQPKPTALQAPAVPEFCAVEAQLTLAEIIRNARRYLALRENEVIIMQAADPDFDAEGYRARYDAAADRLLEGGV